MAIDVSGGGGDCDTRPSTGGIGTTCTVLMGGMFTVRGYVDSIAGLPDGNGNTISGYIVFQFRIEYTSAGLSRNDRAGSGEVGSPTTYWGPPCSPNNETDLAGSYHVDCWGPGTESTYVGKLIEVDFTCDAPGMWTITMEDFNTYLHNDGHSFMPEDKEGDELLIINCASSVGGIAELPGPSSRASAVSEGDSPSSVRLAYAGAAGAISLALAGGGAIWHLRRQRTR